MKQSLKKGIGFGLTSGVITTLGLIIGLNSGTHSKSVIIAGILIIAIADAFSDALGVHISEESEKNNSQKHIWNTTFATLLSKLFFALTFLIPILLFNLNLAIIISLIWGLLLITIFSYYIAKGNKLKIILEHLTITILVIIATHFIGKGINNLFT
jgi:vacuolar iron transporter family protein